MKLQRIALACALSLAATSIFAQSTDAPAEKAPAAKDCVKRHDHGAERQAPTPDKGCKPAQKTAKSKAAAPKEKTIEGHDHGKVHKNQ